MILPIFIYFFDFLTNRYIYVCHAPVARTWCTMPRVLKCVAWISVMASLHQSTRFVDRTYEPIEISWRGQDSVVVCKVSPVEYNTFYLIIVILYTLFIKHLNDQNIF